MSSLFHIFVLAALFLSSAYGELTGKVMQTYGGGSHTFVTHLRIPPTDTLVSVHLSGIDRQIATGVSVRTVRTSDGVNATARISTDGALGFTRFVLTAKTSSGRRFNVPGSLDVLGVRLSNTPDTVTAQLYSGRGATVRSLADCRVGVVRENGADSLLKNEDLSVVGNTLRLRTASRLLTSQHKVGVMRRAKVSVDCPCISLDGETAEHEIEVRARDAMSDQLEMRI